MYLPSYQRRWWPERRLCCGRPHGLERREAQESSLYRRLTHVSTSILLALLVSTRYVGQTRMTLGFVFRLYRMVMTSI